MRTGSLICLLVWKCLCVTVSRGKTSIYFLLNIGYVVYVVYVGERYVLTVGSLDYPTRCRFWLYLVVVSCSQWVGRAGGWLVKLYLIVFSCV